MKDLAKLVETLRQLNSQMDRQKMTWNLPPIIVIGHESVGKLSLLKSITGEEFLPEVRGIVTRSPVSIQLREPVIETKATFEIPKPPDRKRFLPKHRFDKSPSFARSRPMQTTSRGPRTRRFR